MAISFRTIRDEGVQKVANAAARNLIIATDGYLVEQLDNKTLWAWDQGGNAWLQINGGAGTVASVGLSLPTSIFNVSGSPVLSTGTLTGTLKTQNAKTVFAGPVSGSAAAPTMRLLTTTDIPTPATAVGDILYYDGTNMVPLPIGSTGNFLGIFGGLPAWVTGGGGGGGGTPVGPNGSIQYNQSGSFNGFGTWNGSVFTFPAANITGLTASQLVTTDASKNLVSLPFTSQPIVTTAANGIVSSAQYSQIEWEFAHVLSTATYFKEFIYTTGNLTQINIYTDATKLSKEFQKDFSYSAGNITQILITRIADSATFTKAFTYSSGVLQSIGAS